MIEYPPPYKQLVWDYKKANIESIHKTLGQINWRFLFSNKSVHQQVKILINTLMNVSRPQAPRSKRFLRFHNSIGFIS